MDKSIEFITQEWTVWYFEVSKGLINYITNTINDKTPW